MFLLVTRSVGMISPVILLVTRSVGMISPMILLVTRSVGVISPMFLHVTRSVGLISPMCVCIYIYYFLSYMNAIQVSVKPFWHCHLALAEP